jgi:hypothetical protein
MNLKSRVEERFLRSGTAKTAVPPVGMTKREKANPRPR